MTQVDEIDKDGWQKWQGGECPVPPETMVLVQLREETREHADDPRLAWAAKKWRWSHTPDGPDDIITYRVLP